MIKTDCQKVYEYDLTKLRNLASEFEYVKANSENIEGFENYADKTDCSYDWFI